MSQPPEAPAPDILTRLREISASSAFNAWAGFEVRSAGGGAVEIAIEVRPDFRQHAGFLHAGMATALLDTACGYAAGTLIGATTASQVQVMFYAPGIGDRFVARANVVKAGKRQVFAAAELFAVSAEGERLVAGATVVPIRLP